MRKSPNRLHNEENNSKQSNFPAWQLNKQIFISLMKLADWMDLEGSIGLFTALPT